MSEHLYGDIDRSKGRALYVEFGARLLHHTDIQAVHLHITPHDVIYTALDWYVSDSAEVYRSLPFDEVPALPDASAKSQYPRDATGLIRVVDQQQELLDSLLSTENISMKQLVTKALTCYLYKNKIDQITLEELYDGIERDESGFMRPEAPLPDPRDVGL